MIICAVDTVEEFKAAKVMMEYANVLAHGLPNTEATIKDFSSVSFVFSNGFRELIELHTSLLNMIVSKEEFNDEKSWSDSLINFVDDKILTYRTIKNLDWNGIDYIAATFLGFRKWDNTDLWLIPRYLLNAIPIGLEVESVNGKTIVNDGSNLDTDTRDGLLAYGIHIKD